MNSDIKKKIIEITKESNLSISNVNNLDDLENLRILYLGKKGQITSLLKNLRLLDPNDKIDIGKELNLIKNSLNNQINEKRDILNNRNINDKLAL